MKKKNKLQYISDIHLEFRKLSTIPTIEPIEPGNTYLALCGDIGNPGLPTYKAFLDIHAPLFVHILIVAGNHEYYSGRNNQRTIKQTDDMIREIVKGYDNITYLNMDRLVINRTKFIGCPLWTDVTMIKNLAEIGMNDYKNIYVDSNTTRGELVSKFYETKKITKYIKAGKSSLKANDVINMNHQMRDWLKLHIEKTNPDKYDNIIVLTHHAPSFKMLPKLDEYSDCYGSDCENLMKTPVTHWISGHTHGCMKVDINGVSCLSNCMGYPDQKINNYNNLSYIEF